MPAAPVGGAPGAARPVGDLDKGQERLRPAPGDRPLAGQAGGPVPAARSIGRGDGQAGLSPSHAFK